MSADVKWEDPPALGNGNGRYDEIAQALRDNPGRWALISDDAAGSLVTHVKTGGGVAAFRPAGSFEARGQQITPGRARVWARYVGESA